MLQRSGARVLGGCSSLCKDHFSFIGSLSTTAEVIIGVALNPSLGKIDSGDYALVLEPKVAVFSKQRNIDIEFRVSGINPISAAWNFLSAVTSTFLKSFTALVTGDSVSDVFDDFLLHDIGIPLILGVGSLPRPLEETIFSRILKLVEAIAEKRSAGFGRDLEDKHQADLARALKVEEDRKRVIVIKHDVVSLLRLGGVNTDVIIEAPNPSKDCFNLARSTCSRIRGRSLSSECSRMFANCATQKTKYFSEFRPSSVMRSKSKI